MRDARRQRLDQVLLADYRLAWHKCNGDADFVEGIRAKLIEKTGDPKWQPATVPEVRRLLRDGLQPKFCDGGHHLVVLTFAAGGGLLGEEEGWGRGHGPLCSVHFLIADCSHSLESQPYVQYLGGCSCACAP